MHRVEHKEHISEHKREYRQEHKEHISEYNREYRQEHKEHISEHKREYYQEHKEHISEHKREYRAVGEAARAERDFELLAERGEDRTYDEFLNAVEDESQKCMVQLVSGLLQAGRGINILCAGKNRTPPNRSNQQDADGSSFGRIEVSGTPPDGDSSDETRRWAVHDPRPSVVDGRTHSSLSGPRFDALFDKFLVRTHRYHEFVRMFEGQLQRLVCSDSYEKYWSLYLNSKTGDLDGTRYPGECPSSSPRRRSRSSSCTTRASSSARNRGGAASWARRLCGRSSRSCARARGVWLRVRARGLSWRCCARAR